MWQSGTNPGTSPAPVIIVQDDGNLVGYWNGAYWATYTFAPPAPTPPGLVTTTTGYGDPVGGQATTSTVDPGGLALTSTTTFAPRSGGAGTFMRRTGRTLPAGASSGNTYTSYGASETPPAPVCAVGMSRRIQPVVAPLGSFLRLVKISAAVAQSRHLPGRSLSSAATCWRRSGLWTVWSVPLGT